MTTTKKKPAKRAVAKKTARDLKSATVAMSIAAAPVDLSVHSDATTYMLRTSDANRRSHNNFQYPETGLVRPTMWDARPICGYGIHGLLHGHGKQSLFQVDLGDRVWQLIRVRRSEIVYVTEDDGGKWKVPEAFVVHTGTMESAVKLLMELDGEAVLATVPGGSAVEHQAAGASSATGYRGASSATGYQGASSATGYQGASSATGEQGASSATGYRGASSATGYRGASSATGYQGASSATGEQGASSATGEQGVALARNSSRARVGPNGLLILIDDSSGRPRAVVGYAGEDGIKELTWYKLVGGKIVESPDNDPNYLPWVEPTEIVKQRFADEAIVAARARLEAMLAPRNASA